ncbi:hypothetical protein DPEC_G00349960 [Dallia pectoralis]|uniref:Uncharacterized protein n=1 Tax=Dallia pectoralis TaxID=75939 RepID=A0ACC2F1M0_DALPE|nr:hypothetical protein DPEC_G00349960 [Dallia pectoralis]
MRFIAPINHVLAASAGSPNAEAAQRADLHHFSLSLALTPRTWRRKGARRQKADLLSCAQEVENKENCLLISTAAQRAKKLSHALSSQPPARGLSGSERQQKKEPRRRGTKQPS